jgi:hypothetical protein
MVRLKVTLADSGMCQDSDRCGARIEHGTARIGIRNTKSRAACTRTL